MRLRLFLHWLDTKQILLVLILLSCIANDSYAFKVNLLKTTTQALLNFRHSSRSAVSPISSRFALEERTGDGEVLRTVTFAGNTSCISSWSPQTNKSLLYGSTVIVVVKAIRKLVLGTLVPKSFRRGIPSDYVQFQKWNILQDSSSTLRGILATHAVFTGLGIGNGASSKKIAMHWVLRDGISKFSGLLFSSLASTTFGGNPKRWRLFADTMNNVGLTLDMITPFCGKYFFVVLILSSVSKALCGVAASASSATINQHWGSMMGADIAEIISTSNTLTTVCSLVVTAFGALLLAGVARHIVVAWAIYAVLTIAHMYSNYRAMKAIALRTINSERLKLLMKQLFSHEDFDEFLVQSFAKLVLGPRSGNVAAMDEIVNPMPTQLWTWLENHQQQFSPALIASLEPILPEPIQTWAFYIRNRYLSRFNRGGSRSVPLSIGVESTNFMNTTGSVEQSLGANTLKNGRDSSPQLFSTELWCSPFVIARIIGSDNVTLALDRYRNERYFLTVVPATSNQPGSSTKNINKITGSNICISVANDASDTDVASAMFEGEVLRIYIKVAELLRRETKDNSCPVHDAFPGYSLCNNDYLAIRKITSALFPVWWKFIGGHSSDLKWDIRNPNLLLQPPSPLVSLSAPLCKLWLNSSESDITESTAVRRPVTYRVIES